MATASAPSLQLHVVILVDALLGTTQQWTQQGMQDYLGRTLNVLVQANQQAKLHAASIVFASSSPSAAPELRHNSFTDAPSSIIEELVHLLDPTRSNLRPVNDNTASSGLLDAFDAALELLDSAPACEPQLRRQHILVMSLADVPSLFGDEDEASWDCTPSRRSHGVTWQDLPRRLHTRSIGMTLIAPRPLPKLESLQRKVIAEFGVENAPPTAVTTHNPEHGIFLQSPQLTRSSSKRAGSPSATRAAEEAKRPRTDRAASVSFIDPEQLKTMNRDQLQAQNLSTKESGQRLFNALQAQFAAKRMSQEQLQAAVESLKTATQTRLTLIDNLLKALPPEPSTSSSGPRPLPPSHPAAAPVVAKGPLQPGQPAWRGALAIKVPERPGRQAIEFNVLSALVTTTASQDFGLVFPPRLEVIQFVPLDMSALQRFTTAQQLPVFRLVPIPANILDANPTTTGHGVRNETSYKQLSAMLDSRRHGALIALPGLPPNRGLLVIAGPQGKEAGLLVILCSQHPLPHDVVVRPNPNSTPQLAQTQTPLMGSSGPPRELATEGQLEALQAMLSKAGGKAPAMAGLGIGHPSM